MKKILLFAVATFVVSSLSAQFYAGLGVGYGLGVSSGVVGYEVSDDGNTTTNVYGSYGQGFNITGKAGFMFSDYLGAELGMDYFMGAAQTNEKSKTNLVESSSNAFILAPQFVIKTEMGLYSRFGVVLPVAGATTTTGKYENYGGSGQDFEFEKESQGAFSMGVIAAVGYNYALSDNMDLYAELQYVGMSVKSGTSKFTKKTMGSTDLLDGANTKDIETEFVDSIDHTATQEDDKPSQELAGESPFSSFGLNIGVVMKF